MTDTDKEKAQKLVSAKKETLVVSAHLTIYDARRLQKAFLEGKLKEFGIVSITGLAREKEPENRKLENEEAQKSKRSRDDGNRAR